MSLIDDILATKVARTWDYYPTLRDEPAPMNWRRTMLRDLFNLAADAIGFTLATIPADRDQQTPFCDVDNGLIFMPGPDMYKSPWSWARDVAHELTHATGILIERESMLVYEGELIYIEEIVAEFGSILSLQRMFGTAPNRGSLKYIAKHLALWAECTDDCPKQMLATCYLDADAATRYLAAKTSEAHHGCQ